MKLKIIVLLIMAATACFFIPGCGSMSNLTPPSYKPSDRTDQETQKLWNEGKNYPVAGGTIFNGSVNILVGNNQTLLYTPQSENTSDSIKISLVFNLNFDNNSNDKISIPVNLMKLKESEGREWPVAFYQNTLADASIGDSRKVIKPADKVSSQSWNMSSVKGNISTSGEIIIEPKSYANYNIIFGTTYADINQLPKTISFEIITDIGSQALRSRISFNKASIKE